VTTSSTRTGIQPRLDPDGFVARIATAPNDPVAWLRSQPPPILSLPCSPWDRWALLALHRHHARQAFVEAVVRERLGVSPSELGRNGSFGRPEQVAQSGAVPGRRDWHYRFHGRGCCLTKPDGTEIDVDFDEHGSAPIDPWFYARYLETVGALELIERRLCLQRPGSHDGWRAALQPLRDAGLIDGDHGVAVATGAFDWCEAVSNALMESEGDEARLAWVAYQIEDMPLVRELLDDETPEHIVSASHHQTTGRCDELESRVHRRYGRDHEACVRALAVLHPARAHALARREIENGHVDVVLSRCMDLLMEAPRAEDAPAVTALLLRLQGSQPPAPHLRLLAARYLLSFFRRDTIPAEVRDNLLQAIHADQAASEGDAAMISYLLDRDDGLRRMRVGLRSSVPLARAECAAALALVGSAEAIDVLRSAATPETSAMLAFLRGSDPEGFEPVGTIIEWAGTPKRVYTLDELIASEFEPFTFEVAKSFFDSYEPIVRRWDAH